MKRLMIFALLAGALLAACAPAAGQEAAESRLVTVYKLPT